jgi:hypothetical protein
MLGWRWGFRYRRVYVCPVCRFQFMWLSSAQAHMKDVHGTPEVAPESFGSWSIASDDIASDDIASEDSEC